MAVSETKTSWEFNPRVFDRKAHSKCLTKDIVQGKPCKTFNTDRCVDGTDDIWHGYYGTKAKFMKDFKKGYEHMVDMGMCGVEKVLYRGGYYGTWEYYTVWSIESKEHTFLPTDFPTDEEMIRTL